MQGHRFEHRKKQRVNRILNIAISLVVILILFFGAQILLDSPKSEETTIDPEDQSVLDEEPKQYNVSDPKEKQPQTEKDLNTIKEDETDKKVEDKIDENKDQDEPVSEEDLEPGITTQTGEFSHDFDREGTNWAEMTESIRYATGLGDDMIIWRLENGGSETRARGVVSGPDSKGQPYEVYIEWVDGQGWTPVEKSQLQNNPYGG